MNRRPCGNRNTVPPGFACTKPVGHRGGHAWVDGVRRGVPTSAWPNLRKRSERAWEWIGFVLVGMLMVSWVISTLGLVAIVLGWWGH